MKKLNLFNSFLPVKKASSPMKVAVTGAFTYSGRYMTKLLLQDPNITEIRNFTNHPNRTFEKNPENLSVHPLDFDDMTQLKKNLEGVDLLF